jgi:tyrosine-specific transport protein
MNSRLLGGILLIAGTSIGAGMLALPVLTATAGFAPSILLFILVWLGTLFTALLVLEVNLWFKEDVNLISMAKFTLGRFGEAITWVFFLLLLYSLTAAYLAGSATTIACQLKAIFNTSIPSYLEPLPLLLIFAGFIYFGTKPSDMFNRVCMVVLVICYFGLITTVIPHTDLELIRNYDFSYAFISIPVVVTSFGFHVIIPVLTTYLKQDVKALKKAIWIGSSIPLFVYILWEFVILAVVPVDGEFGLNTVCRQGTMVTESLANLLQNGMITTFASTFSFFAILTSFLGVSLSLASFLKDGFNIKENYLGKLWIVLLTFGPPLLFVFFYPRGFVLALLWAGIIVAFLHGILPALMVLKGRNQKREQVLYRVKCGNFALICVIIVSIAIIVLEVLEKLHA